MVVEDGSTVENADSVVSVEFANAYFDARQNFDWLAVDAESSLIKGTAYVLGRYRGRWKGTKVDADQALDWPRQDVVDEDGLDVASDAIPTRLKQAVCEAALLLGQGIDLSPVTTTAPVKRLREKVGPIEEETEYVGAGTIPARPTVSVIDDLLQGYIGGFGIVGSAARA